MPDPGQEREALNAAWNRCVEGRERPFPSGDAGFWFHAGFEACYEAALAAHGEPQGPADLGRLFESIKNLQGYRTPSQASFLAHVDSIRSQLIAYLAAREDTERAEQLKGWASHAADGDDFL